MLKRRLVSFDWAMKKLLRSKASFEILEGFLSELLRDDIRILEILESESNKEGRLDKFNRVDLKVKNQKEEILLIEAGDGLSAAHSLQHGENNNRAFSGRRSLC